jgi:hypothetical protein
MTTSKINRLNEMFTDSYSEGQLVDNFIYLTNKSRGKYCSENAIRKAHLNREFAQLLRRLDPIAYNQL